MANFVNSHFHNPKGRKANRNLQVVNTKLALKSQNLPFDEPLFVLIASKTAKEIVLQPKEKILCHLQDFGVVLRFPVLP